MFRYLIFCIVFFPAASLYAQHIGKATYTYKMAEGWHQYEGMLIFSSEESVFYYYQANKLVDHPNFSEQTAKSVFLISDGTNTDEIYTDSLGYVIFHSNKTHEVQERKYCSPDKVYQLQDVVEWQWTFGNNHKTIAGFDCSDATTTFRGRTYTAWYAPAIPIQAGPWKFFDLPGLILEVSDSRNEVWFLIESLEMSLEPQQITFNFGCPAVTFKELQSCLDSTWEKKVKKIKNKFIMLQAQHPNLDIEFDIPRVRPATEKEVE